MLIAFHKPYGVLSQFTPGGSAFRTLAEFGFPPRVYPIGRLDADSEGLLLLSDEPEINERLLHPRHGHRRVYWAQVERIPTAEALRAIEEGVLVQGRRTLPCRARMLAPQPVLPPRDPPIRLRKRVADCWIALELVEGKNRQVRRMTAAIGHPTLRLIRVQIGEFKLEGLGAGAWRVLTAKETELVFHPETFPGGRRAVANSRLEDRPFRPRGAGRVRQPRLPSGDDENAVV
jgi:23S rRNA pseudouridine2457 synthase